MPDFIVAFTSAFLAIAAGNLLNIWNMAASLLPGKITQLPFLGAASVSSMCSPI
jgi:hypothetical protein